MSHADLIHLAYKDLGMDPEDANPLGQAQDVSGSNPTSSGGSTGPGQAENKPLFTPKFFSDMADEVLAHFPYKEFAASHNCSTEDVSRALMATVLNTLLAENPSSTLLEEGADFQTQVETWEGQYQVMVSMLTAGEGTALHRQLDQAVAANQHNIEGHEDTSGAREGDANMTAEHGDAGVMAPTEPNHDTDLETAQYRGTNHDELARLPIDPALIDPQLSEDSAFNSTCDGFNVANDASLTAENHHLPLPDQNLSSLEQTSNTNLKKRSRSDENETTSGGNILIAVPEFTMLQHAPKKRRLNPIKVTNTRPWLQSALRKMYLQNCATIPAYRRDNAVRNVSETLARVVASVTASQPQHPLLNQQQDDHATFPLNSDAANLPANERCLRFPELSRRKRMYRDKVGSYHLTRAEEERESQRLLGLLPPQPSLGTRQPYVSLPDCLRTGQGDGKVTNAQGKTLFETATKKDIEWWEKNFKGKKYAKIELNRKRRR